MQTYIAYRRVSTGSQHNGIEAQQSAIDTLLHMVERYWRPIQNRSLVERMSGEPQKAIKHCKRLVPLFWSSQAGRQPSRLLHCSV